MRVKVLTVKQPWASLIVHGIKDIENRSWRTNFRGRVLIHSSAKGDIAKFGCLQPNQRLKVLNTPMSREVSTIFLLAPSSVVWRL